MPCCQHCLLVTPVFLTLLPLNVKDWCVAAANMASTVPAYLCAVQLIHLPEC